MNFKSGPFAFDQEVGIHKKCFIIINVCAINRCFIALQRGGFVLN